MFVTSPNSTWSAEQIEYTRQDAIAAVAWWNHELSTEVFQIGQIGVLGMPDMIDWGYRQTYETFYYLPRRSGTFTMYFYRYPLPSAECKTGTCVFTLLPQPRGWTYSDHDVIRITNLSFSDFLVMRHELGHWLGLPDSCEIKDLMCDIYYKQLDIRSLNIAQEHLGVPLTHELTDVETRTIRWHNRGVE